MFWLRATLLSLLFFIGYAGMAHAQQPPKLDIDNPQKINVEGTLLCDETDQLAAILSLQEQDYMQAAMMFQFFNQLLNEHGQPACGFIELGTFIKIGVNLQVYSVWTPDMSAKDDVYIVEVRYIAEGNRPESGFIFMDTRFFDVTKI